MLLTRFIAGLSALELLQVIRANKEDFKKVFCAPVTKLNAQDIEDLFKIEFSDRSTSQYLNEIRIRTYWSRFIKELPGNYYINDTW